MARIQHNKIGNIVDSVKSGVIIQQVNAQGVMGSGVAKAIRDKWPKVWDEYSKIVRPNTIDMGAGYMGMMIPVEVEPDLIICNVVGQQFYGRDSTKRYTSYDALDAGLAKVQRYCKDRFSVAQDLKWAAQPEIHFPLFGCGLGGGDWRVVSSILDSRLDGFSTFLWLLPEGEFGL